MKSLAKLILCSITLLMMQACTTNTITIDNTQPRLDENGQFVDAHDGRIVQFGDTYYWYGTAYGDTNGFTTANHYVCYSSNDLNNWTLEGRLLPDQPEGVYYRPHVIYNAKTAKYVLWYNWYPQLWNGQFGVATSDNPAGPFEIVNDDVNMHFSSIGVGDFGLYVDDDGTGYISYNTIQGHQVSVEKMTDDYLGSTGENGGVIAKYMEAGTMFKRDGKYYLLTDYTCCFCNYGSGARVYISDEPLSGYTYTGNINRYPGRLANELTDGIAKGTQYATLKKTENGFESLELELNQTGSPETISLHLFTGNRPENCGDVSNPRVHPEITTPEFELFSWDFDQWSPLSFTKQAVNKSALSEVVILELAQAPTSRLKIVPKADYRYEKIYVNEVELGGKNAPIDGIQAYITGQGIPQPPIIPAQQTYVMKLNSTQGNEFIWMGDLWGSASDNIKGHDYQYWSKPLEFNADGTIKPMTWTDQWSIAPTN